MRAAHTGSILAATGLGLATSLGIAWSGLSLGVSDSPSEERWHGPLGHDWLVRIWQGPMVDVGVASLEMPAAAGLQKVDVSEDVLRLLPHAPWRGIVRGSIDRATSGSFWELRAYGWPCKCVAAAYLALPTHGRAAGLGWWTFRLPGTGQLHALPAAPIWSGLAADTALFAAPWWVVLAAGGAGIRLVVRTMRMRRGRCPKCGYDVRGDFVGRCPECGWKR